MKMEGKVLEHYKDKAVIYPRSCPEDEVWELIDDMLDSGYEVIQKASVIDLTFESDEIEEGNIVIDNKLYDFVHQVLTGPFAEVTYRVETDCWKVLTLLK